MKKVLLIDGPYKGAEPEVSGTGTLLIEGDFSDGSGRSEDGAMARYRPTRDKSQYRFKGWSKDVIRLPLPGAAN